MLNYLFHDIETGDNFFVQAYSLTDAEDIAINEVYNGNIVYVFANVEYIDCYTDEEAEMMGYDTY
jgi:hypothetical protein